LAISLIFNIKSAKILPNLFFIASNMETQVFDADPAQEESEPNLDSDEPEGEELQLMPNLISTEFSESKKREYEEFWHPEFDEFDEYYNLVRPDGNNRALFAIQKKLRADLIGADKREREQALRQYRDSERRILEPNQREKTAYSSKSRKSCRSKIRCDKEDAKWAASSVWQNDVIFMAEHYGYIQLGLDALDPRLLPVFCLSEEKKARHSKKVEYIQMGFRNMIQGADVPYFLIQSLKEAKTKQNDLMSELEDPDLTKEREGEIQTELKLAKDVIKSCEEEMRPFISLAYHNRKGAAKQVLNARRKTGGGMIGMSTKVPNKRVRRTQYEDYALRVYSEIFEKTRSTIAIMGRKASIELDKASNQQKPA
jgi:hypothetical protein